ncbi:hypothetical protein [Streptomyces sp. NPDC050560]|uniref:hypothetical protein n=1 Tax=Streptomyces sp. NPDC050560 TaxID=3365630 RepID=UPI003799BA46
MTRTEFLTVASLWFECWALAGVMVYALGTTRSRVPGSIVGRMPLLRLIGRRRAARRAGRVLAALSEAGVAPRHLPDRESLAERIRWRTVGGTFASLLLSVPVGSVVAAIIAAVCRLETRSGPEPAEMGVWFLATVALILPSALPAILDDWGVRRSDASGTAAMRAVAAVETLLLGEGVTGKKTRLEARAYALNRLCRALRDQARHESREAGARSSRASAELTDLLVRNILRGNHELNFAEDDREKAQATRRALAELISSALRYSCRPRPSRDGLGFVDPALLTSAADGGQEEEARRPLGVQLAGVGAQLGLAAAILAAAAFLAPRGVATEALAVLAVALLVPVCRSLSRRLGYEIRLPDISWGAAGGAAEEGATTADRTPAAPAVPVSAPARAPAPEGASPATAARS